MAVKFPPGRAPPFHTFGRCRLTLVHQPPSPHYSSNSSPLYNEMVSRTIPYSTDYMSPTRTRSLRLTLQDFLPNERVAPHRRHNNALDGLQPTHHLVYFPTGQATASLLPDGTESWYSPGPSFTRSLWAGGNMAFLRNIPTDGEPFFCLERIEDVTFRRTEGKERAYVKVIRKIYAGKYPRDPNFVNSVEDEDRPHAKAFLIEGRILAFLQDGDQESSQADSQTSEYGPQLKMERHFSHTMVPNRELLFRFSALTFNAHAIHFDKAYCREVEGHRNLLVQGPLTAVLMAEVLQSYLRKLAGGGKSSSQRAQKIRSLTYRNWTPLYAEEEMRICVGKKEGSSDLKGITIWDVWIERPDGLIAVKGTFKTLDRRFKDSGPSSGASAQEPPPQEGDPELEGIPKEQVDIQKKIKADLEFDQMWIRPDEDVPAEE